MKPSYKNSFNQFFCKKSSAEIKFWITLFKFSNNNICGEILLSNKIKKKILKKKSIFQNKKIFQMKSQTRLISIKKNMILIIIIIMTIILIKIILFPISKIMKSNLNKL